MILKAKERGNAPQLAKYLLSMRDNEHVELHEVRGFVSDDLLEAFAEAEAISKGTKCKKHLFSMSLNPPEGEVVDRHVFERVIDRIEQKLALTNHARAIVFHEKEGRRHAHAVWSRIDSETMRAKNMSFYKQKLMDVSRDLYLQQSWQMPKGMLDKSMRNPLRFTHAEWQQAQRVKTDPRLIKAAIQQCWNSSDNTETLKAALEEKGFFLAKGDRRSVVAIDVRGETYSLSRMANIKARDVRARITDHKDLPSAQDTKAQIATRMTDKLKGYLHDVKSSAKRLPPSVEFKRQEMIQRHREDRKVAHQRIEERQRLERVQRAARLPKGMKGIWSRITGKFALIKEQNEMDALKSWQRDRAAKDALVSKQLDERVRLQRVIDKLREERAREIAIIHKEIAAYLAMKRGDVPSLDKVRRPEAKDRLKVDARKQDLERQRQRERRRSRDDDRDRGPGF